MKIVVDIDPGGQEFAGQDAEAIILRRLAAAPDGRIQVQGFTATVLGIVKEEFSALVPYVAPSIIDGDYPVVCANGCPLGYIGRHKLSCDEARPAKEAK